MLRLLKIIFLVVIALLLLVLELANRHTVTLNLLPQEPADFLGLNFVFEVPLFLVILVSVVAGVLIGFVWEWFREMRYRADAKGKSREVARLERELAALKNTTVGPAKDEVLALVEAGAR